jgi:hypothetical protein
MKRWFILPLASFCVFRAAALLAEPYLGSDVELPGPEVVRVNVSEDGTRIAVGIRSYGQNAFLLDAEGAILLAARVRAVLPDVLCGEDGQTLVAIDDSGVSYRFGRRPTAEGQPEEGLSALEGPLALSSPVAFWDRGAMSSRFWTRRGPTRIDVRRGAEHWHYDDWEHYQTIEDFQHPRSVVASCLSPGFSRLALQWQSVFTFRRQPQERPEAATIQLLNAETGQLLWEKQDLGRLLAADDDGCVLAARKSRSRQTDELVLADAAGQIRSVGEPPGHPLAGLGLGRGRFLIRYLSKGERAAVLLTAASGQFTRLAFEDFTDAVRLADGPTVVGSLSGELVSFGDGTEPEPFASVGCPATVCPMPDGTLLAATTARVARFDAHGRELWKSNLSKAVPGESPRTEILKVRVANEEEDAGLALGLLPKEHALTLSKEPTGPGQRFTFPLEPGVFCQLVFVCLGKLRMNLTLPDGAVSAWKWASPERQHHTGAVLLDRIRDNGEAKLTVTDLGLRRGEARTGVGLRRVEARTWKPGTRNLGQTMAPSIEGTKDDPVEDVQWWVFNPSFYADMMGVRPKEADSKWRPAPVPARSLSDGKTGRRVMETDIAPWWYELRFKSPRTLNALLAFEDLSAAGGWAEEGFVSGLDPQTNAWAVLARFRGQAVGRALQWKPTKVTAIRYHVTKGGTACSEIMLFGPEDAAEVEEMQGEE